MRLTFLRTFDDRLGRGIGLSLSPTSVCTYRMDQRIALSPSEVGGRTFEHVPDEDRLVRDLLLDGELLIV